MMAGCCRWLDSNLAAQVPARHIRKAQVVDDGAVGHRFSRQPERFLAGCRHADDAKPSRQRGLVIHSVIADVVHEEDYFGGG